MTGDGCAGRKGGYEASFTVEASVIMSVILLATGSIICFGYKQKSGVVSSYRSRFETEYAEHEAEEYCPEEYMRQMTIWDGLKKAYLRKNKEDELKKEVEE
jgi:hypothetical protein